MIILKYAKEGNLYIYIFFIICLIYKTWSIKNLKIKFWEIKLLEIK